MQRIGLAASKIAQGNLLWYNFYVILIAFLFSLFIFFIAGAAIVLALILIFQILKYFLTASTLEQEWLILSRFCLGALAIAVGVFNLMAISINIKLKKS